ncbi:MAG: LysR substrate-binding domain-containing protein, partial [Pseudomonadota bacterium]
QINRELADMGVEITQDFFRYRCDDPSVAWELVLAGCGVGLGYTIHAANEPNVQRVLSNAPEMSRPIWLTSHAELKTSARVRAVFDFLAFELTASPGKTT